MSAPLPQIREQARGRWRSILPRFDVPTAFLSGKQQPCPICGGTDRARFDDLDGHGTWFCNQCGAGDGMRMVQALTGVGFADAATRVRELLTEAAIVKGKPPRDDKLCIEAARRLWLEAGPLPGTMAETYLRSRGVWDQALRAGDVVRFSRRLRLPGDNAAYAPAMLARVTDASGASINVHRTYLADGARIHRAIMPGAVPPGSAIRLGPVGLRIGVAEGIETALRAGEIFGVTTWATITAGGMERWEPPAGAERVDIFGDHDSSFTGQPAAFALAKRLTNRRAPVQCTVHIPGVTISPNALDTDWADPGAAEKVAARG